MSNSISPVRRKQTSVSFWPCGCRFSLGACEEPTLFLLLFHLPQEISEAFAGTRGCFRYQRQLLENPVGGFWEEACPGFPHSEQPLCGIPVISSQQSWLQLLGHRTVVSPGPWAQHDFPSVRPGIYYSMCLHEWWMYRVWEQSLVQAIWGRRRVHRNGHRMLRAFFLHYPWNCSFLGTCIFILCLWLIIKEL